MKQLEEGRCSVKVWEVCVGWVVEFRTGSVSEFGIQMLLIRVMEEEKNVGSGADGNVGWGMQ